MSEKKESEFVPWLEKYRPAKLGEVIGQKHAVERMQAYVKSKNLPHMLLTGPAGVGKTSSLLAMARELYGDAIRECFAELNASDARGIDVVRGQIKDFARTLPLSDVPFKLILLDEADQLTDDAQHALRRTMEQYSRNTRFALSCVSPDTKILLPNEVEITIEDFENNVGLGVLSIDEQKNAVSPETVVHYVKLDPRSIGKKTIRLQTMSGRSLELTEDHKLMTRAGWLEAGSLQPGDFVTVYPSLEGTSLEKNDGKIIVEEKFKDFLDKREIENWRKSVSSAAFENLSTREKEAIISRILELRELFSSSLTPREKNVFDLICQKPNISRIEVQQGIGLSRIRTVQLLRSIENKGYVRRSIHWKRHSFSPLMEEAHTIRNKADARRRIEQEFGISISYTTVRNVIEGKLNKSYLSNFILSDLNRKGLLPLTYESSAAPVIARLTGLLLGDGHIAPQGRLIFTTDVESLKELIKDLEKIHCRPSNIFSKVMQNEIRGRKFTGMTNWVHFGSQPIARFFEFLGVPVGDKCINEFQVPYWVLDGTKLVKREFLRGILGSEMNFPSSRRNKGFEALVFKQHKALELVESGREFMRQLMLLLKDFNIKCTELLPREVTPRKNGQRMVELGFWISTETENYFNFLTRIGFAYSVEKEGESRRASEYLRHKMQVLKQLREKGAFAVQLTRSGQFKKTGVARLLGCSADFVSNQLDGKEAGLIRDFPNFEEWKYKYCIKDSPLVWNEIASIEKIELTDVRDLTCTRWHNFISNGFISHNCNYSSRIIEPIQSRCAVFRFKPLEDKEIERIVDHIAAEEGLKIDEKAKAAIVYIAQGDARKAINVLQGAAALGSHVREDDVLSVSSRARPEEVSKMVKLALEGKFGEARKLLDELMIRYGMSGEDVISQVYGEVTRLGIGDASKVELVDSVGEYDFRLSQGADSRIQLEALLARIALLGKGGK